MIGGIAHATRRLRLGTGVTGPLIRYHPALVAQAAATAALPGELNTELSLPRQFEQAAKLVREEDVAQAIVCGADPERHLQAIKELVEAGYDHVYVHQVGPDQERFFRFYE